MRLDTRIGVGAKVGVGRDEKVIKKLKAKMDGQTLRGYRVA